MKAVQTGALLSRSAQPALRLALVAVNQTFSTRHARLKPAGGLLLNLGPGRFEGREGSRRPQFA